MSYLSHPRRWRLAPLAIAFAVGGLAAGCLESNQAGAPNDPPVENPTDDPRGDRELPIPASDRSPMPPSTVAVPSNVVCGEVAADDAPLMLLPQERQVQVVLGDGTLTPLAAATENVPNGHGIDYTYATSGPTHAVTTVSYGGNGGGTVVTAFDPDLGVMWQKVWSQRANAHHLGRDGSTLVYRYSASGSFSSDLVVVRADGTVHPTPSGFNPSGGASSNGLIPGHLVDVVGWLDPATGSFRGYDVAPMAVAVVDDRLVLVVRGAHDGSGAIHFVDSDPDVAPIVVGLSDPTVIDQGLWAVATNGPWIVYTSGDYTGFVRVNAATTSVDVLRPTAPTGTEWLRACSSATAAVDATGRLMMTFRDAAEAGLYRLESDGATWTRLGRPLTGIDSVEPIVQGTTALIASYAYRQVYCEPPAWDEPGDDSDALVGDALQAVRGAHPASPLVIPLESGYPSLSPNGACVAIVRHGEAGSIDLIDLETGRTTSLPGLSGVIWTQR